MADSRISNRPLSARMHARSTGSREQSINFLLDHSALEEIRIHPCVQLDRVNEHEVAKIFLSDEPLFDQFPRLGRGVTHVEQVAMTDVGTEDHVEPHVERIVLRVERPCGNVVVALASEEEAGHEEVTDIRGLPDCATRELVEIGRVFGRTPLNVANFVGAGWKLVGEPRAPYLRQSSMKSSRFRFLGSKLSRTLTLCIFQWLIRSPYRTRAHPTPPSWKANLRVGKRRVTPPKKSALQTASEVEAKWPMWLYMKLEIEPRKPMPVPGEWNDGATPSSTHFAHTGS